VLCAVADGSSINCSVTQVNIPGAGSQAEAVALPQHSGAVFTALSGFSVGSAGRSSHYITQTVSTTQLAGKIVQINKSLIFECR
jgi:hypothetical protein